MNSLELKIPPVALVLLIALAMWGVSLATPGIALPFTVRAVTAIVLVAAGASISIAGVAAFRKARTTVNPTKPDATSALVSSGIYGLTRNPMYLGFLLVLVGWAAFLSNAVALIGVFAYVLYMNRFQIAPEERALSAMFGAEFAAYKTRVRRWL
jgi:protein-S-isoprenylcysteine O-methyltransferase Ste14